MLSKIHLILPRETKKSILLLCLALGMVGISYGSLSIGYGFPLWIPLLTSVIVAAGSSEFIFLGIIASGGHPIAAAIAGLLVNARHFPFGLAVRELVGSRMKAILGAYIMNDSSVVFGMSQSTHKMRVAAYWVCGIGVVIFWPLGTLIGGLLGKILPSPQNIGLDAVFPTVLLALVIPAFKNKTTLLRSSAGALISLITIPLIPAGAPFLLSILGLLVRKK
ncbi:AzlC family ABC transporter permease [Pantoea sp. App145]|uniref:AzlC family ABC transporter permease n=1 Tax=Pantoea sp. App145 TaxID=3071567 RepID=UPI003A80738D